MRCLALHPYQPALSLSLATRIFQRAFCHFEICHLTCGNNKVWQTDCATGEEEWQEARESQFELGSNAKWGTGQAGVGYMALGGIMLAFGINVSQFRENLLCFPLLPLVVVVWGICTNVI